MNRGSPNTRSQKARRAVVRSPSSSGRDPRDAAAPQDVVGEDQRTWREAPIDEGVEICRVFLLDRVDEHEIEWAGQCGLGGPEGVERLGRDDRDALVRDAGLAPPASGEVGPLAVRVDRDDRAVVGLAEGQPQRREPVGRPDLDDPAPAPGERRQHAARIAIDDRDPERLGGGLDGCKRRRQRRRDRLDPVEVGGAGDPVALALHRCSKCVWVPVRPAGRSRNTGRPRGSCPRRWCRR